MTQSFRAIAYLEGLSFLVLLFIAMPLKYFWDSPESTRIVGAIHGALFLLYIVIATIVGKNARWPLKTFILSYVASTLPFGPFIFDRHLSNR